MSTFYNNQPFCPFPREKAKNTDWEKEHGITVTMLKEGRKIATAKLREIKNKHPAFSTVADYWIAIINVAVPGDRLFFFLLHCSLNWFKGHITFNCGGNWALGSPKDLKKSQNCTLTAIRPLSKYVKDNCHPSLVMGHDADAVGGINANQFCCPCCGPEFERCPNIHAIRNRTDVLISILSIGFDFCTEFKIAAFMNSLGGMTTNVNVVIDGLQHCNSDTVTICRTKVPHWQHSRVPFPPLQSERAFGPSVYLRTSRRISSQLDEVSACLENHLRKIGGPIPDRSLIQYACEDPDLLLVQENPTIETFENLVRVRESRKEQIVNYIVWHMGDHRDQLVLGLEGVPDYIINYAQKHILELQAEFSIGSIEEVKLHMLHQVMTAHAVEQSRRNRANVLGDSIPNAFRNSSVKEVVCNLSTIPEIDDVANYEIDGMSFGGGGDNPTFKVGVTSYRNRRSIADNPSGDNLLVRIQWKDGADTTKKDTIRNLMSAILAQGLEHEVFKNLPWREIKAFLLTVFGVDLEFEYLLQKAIKGKSGVADIVAAIKDMRQIRELAAKIAGMKLGASSTKSTFSVYVLGYRNRRSVADNPGSDNMRVHIQWKDGADTTKKDTIRNLMSAILAQGLEHEVFKNLPWREIKAFLLTVFGVDLEFEYLLQKAIKGKSGVADIVAAIKDMRQIRELAAKIAGMKLGASSTKSTFSVYVLGYRNRRSVADNPGSDNMRVHIQWKDGADTTKKDTIRNLMSAILAQGLEHEVFKNLPWREIKAFLLTVFGVDLEFEYLLQKAIKGKSGVADIVAAIKDMRQIRELAAKIAGMKLGASSTKSTFSVYVLGYRNRRSVADNPGSDYMRVHIQWRDDADDIENRSGMIRGAMKNILDVWIEAPDFQNLHWGQITGHLKNIFV